MAFTPGARLGPYEVVSAIGAGGMGEVYKARDTRLHRDVAVKVLPADVSSDPERLARFEQEARAAAALNHPNILAVHDLGTQGGTTYLVSELLDGRTLSAVLADPLPIKKAIEYAIQVAAGLTAAHEKGIVHRDLKPDNLFVTADGRVKILDFGLAKLQSGPASGVTVAVTAAPTTQPGMVMGTAGYMAPEQVRGVAADHRADIFSLGAVLYEMLSGRRAFARETGSETMTAILREEPPELSSAVRPMPPALERIVARCMEKSPAQRFQSASDLAFALDALSSARTAVSSAEPPPSRAVPASTRSAGRAPWIVAAAASLIAALLAVPAVRYFRTPAVAPPEMRLQVVTPSTDDPTSFAISPDGRQIAFVATIAGHTQVWLRSLGDVASRPLDGSDGATAPFWSPDSRAIGFVADGRLKRADLAGGTVRALTTTTAGWGAAWTLDGASIVYAANASSPLLRIGAEGGEPAVLTTVEKPHQSAHRFPKMLPDGRHFLYFVLGSAEGRGVHVAALDDPKGKRLLEADSSAVYVPPGYLLFARQNALLAIRFDLNTLSTVGEPFTVAPQFAGETVTSAPGLSSAATGTFVFRHGAQLSARELAWVDRSGRPLGTVGPPDPNGPTNVELSADGSRIALDRTIGGNTDVWLIEADRGVSARFTFDSGLDRAPIWSPDGRDVVFGSNRLGVTDIYRKAANGAQGSERVVFKSAQLKLPEAWSPDGRFLLFRSVDPKMGRDLYAVAADGSGEAIVVRRTEFEEMQSQFSPDGRWVAFMSNQSGVYEIYVQAFPNGTSSWQISSAGGVQPRWSHDGKELFYIAPDSQLVAVPVTVSPDRQSLQPGRAQILFPSRIISSAPGIGRQQYDVSADGKRFLIDRTKDDGALSPLTIVLNWAGARESK